MGEGALVCMLWVPSALYLVLPPGAGGMGASHSLGVWVHVLCRVPVWCMLEHTAHHVNGPGRGQGTGVAYHQSTGAGAWGQGRPTPAGPQPEQPYTPILPRRLRALAPSPARQPDGGGGLEHMPRPPGGVWALL